MKKPRFSKAKGPTLGVKTSSKTTGSEDRPGGFPQCQAFYSTELSLGKKNNKPKAMQMPAHGSM